MKAKEILTVILVVAIAGVAVLVLPGCNALANQDRAAAARLQAEAELARAEASRETAKAQAEADRVKAQAEAETQRQRALAEKTQAEADAYQKRLQADATAAAERSALRQSERDAAYERTLGLLPFVLLIAGVIAVGALAVVSLAGRPQRAQQVDPSVVFLLRQQDQRLAELERATYHAIAMTQRQQLTNSTMPVIIYEEKSHVQQ